MHLHPHGLEFGASAQIGQVDDEGAADDLRAQAFDQFDPSLGRAARGQKIIDQQHLISGGQPAEAYEQALRQIAQEV